MKDRAAAAPDAALSPSNAQSPLCENRIAIGGWDVTAATAPMAGSAELDALGDALGGLKPPSMVFARSHLTLRRGAFTLSFNAPAALEGVGAHDPTVQVRAAQKWAAHAARAPVELCAGPPSSSRDWTYTTRYAGSSAGGVEEHGGEVIDMDALRDMSRPIRYSAAVPLFDDELDDNGAASYGVRIRCMPDFLFVLARFFLRVDGVLLRVVDARYFHRYESRVLVKETTCQEHRYDSTHSSLPASILAELGTVGADTVARHLPVLERRVVNISLPE